MMPPEERHSCSFVATDDAGNEYTVDIYTEIIDAGSHDQAGEVLEGIKRLCTEDGMAVNRIKKGIYQVVITGEIIKSDDPDAP